MKGETQVVERILQSLSNRITQDLDHPEDVSQESFESTIFSMVFAVLLLNTDQHHPDVIDRMKFNSFEQNFRLVVPDERLVTMKQLRKIFEDIKVGL